MIKKITHHKNKLTLMILAILQILVSFFTNFFIVKEIGFTSELDVFYLSMAVYLFLHTSINWPFAAIITPLMIENKEKRLEKNLFINILVISLILFFLLYTTMFMWIDLIFKNYLQIIELQTIKTIQSIFLITFVIDSLSLVFLSILQQKDNYILINLLSLSSSIISFLFIYNTINFLGIYSATYGQLIIRLFIFIILFSYLIKYVVESNHFEIKYSLILFNRVKHLIFGSFYFRINDLLDRYIATYLSSGFLSLASFIQKLYESFNTVINTSIVAPTITKFSYLLKENKYKEVKRIIYSYTLFIFILVTIFLIFIFFFGEQLFLVFFAERLDKNLSSILFISLICIFIICYTQTIGKIFQNLLLSLNKEKLITYYDVVSFTITIPLKISMTFYFEIFGFLISFVLSEMIKFLLKGYLLITQIRKINV